MGQRPSGAFDGMGTGTFPGGPALRAVQCAYDFTKQGGAQGSIVIGTLPPGCFIVHGWVVIDTAITSGGAATAGLSSEGAGDLKATATLISAAPWTGAAGTKAGITPTLATVSTYARDERYRTYRRPVLSQFIQS
jgi:hypothetical protein